MNKTLKLIAVSAVFGLLVFGSNASADNEWVQAEVGATYQPMGWATYEASWLIGHYVYSPDRIPLGQISSLVIDKANGRICLAVLSDVEGLGGTLVAVPFSSLVRTGEDSFEFSFGDREIEVASGYRNPYGEMLARAPSTSDLYGIPSVIDRNWVETIYRHYGQAPYWTERGEKPLAEMEFFKSSALMGSNIQTRTGGELAMVDDFVIDSSNGRVVFLVLSDIRGRGDALVAVPFDTLSRDGGVFVLDISDTRLASAPSFDEFGMVSRQWAEGVYTHFGEHPYWTEGGEYHPY
jgi:sporulation protein YlmC with PRC-barrel domain